MNFIKILRHQGLRNLNRQLSQSCPSPCDPPCPCPPPPAPNPCPKPPSPCPPPRSIPQGRCQSIDVLNPCNYCPPQCPDKDYPAESVKRIKRAQCFYQQNMDVPVYLAKGTSDKILFNIATIMTIIAVINSCYIVYEIVSKY